MFVRFRATPHRLQASVIETRRVDGRVRHEHIAALGSVGLPLSAETRAEFWGQLWPRVARLSNRLDAAAQEKVCDDLHARIPLVTLDEIVALQVEAARADDRFWSTMQASNEDMAASFTMVAEDAEMKASAAKSAAENASKKARAAKERLGKLERGEAVEAGIKKPDFEKMLRRMGFSDTDFQHWRNVTTIHELGATERYVKAVAPDEKRERRIAHKILRAASRGPNRNR